MFNKRMLPDWFFAALQTSHKCGHYELGTKKTIFMNEIKSWLDSQIPSKWPDNVKAVSFNLNDGLDVFAIEMIGADEFDAEDEDWACSECWEPEIRKIDTTITASDGWEKCLEICKEAVTQYITDNPEKFRGLQGVGVGFVDGDLHNISIPN